MMELDGFLQELARRRGDAVVVTTMGAVRPWARHSTSPFDFASADSAMGHAADFALGLALAQTERPIWCLNGDGSMLMSLGTLVTIAAAAPSNYVLFIIENGTYEITGNQPLPAASRIDFERLAKAAGINRSWRLSERAECAGLDDILAGSGPTVVVVEVEPGQEGPLSRGPHNPERSLKPSLAESAHDLALRLAGHTPPAHPRR